MQSDLHSSESDILRSFFSNSDSARILICAPSQSGKTFLIARIIDNEERLFGSRFDQIFIFNSFEQTVFEKFEADDRFSFENERSPTEVVEFLSTQPPARRCFILDDIISHSAKLDPKITQLWTGASHHLKISVIATTQFLFGAKHNIRNISLQSSVIVLFPSFRDRTSIKVFTRQAFPDADSNFLASVLEQVNKGTVFKVPVFVNVSSVYPHERLRVLTGPLTGEELLFWIPKRQ